MAAMNMNIFLNLIFILKVPLRNILPIFIPNRYVWDSFHTDTSQQWWPLPLASFQFDRWKKLPCYFLIVSKIKFFHMFVGDLYFSLSEWPVQFLCPFLSLQRVVYLLCSTLSHFILHCTFLANMSTTIIDNTGDNGNPHL